MSNKENKENVDLDKENVAGEQHKFFSDEIRARQEKQRKLALLWPILSFILHIAGFFALVFCTPLREVIFEKKEDQPKETKLSQMTEREIEDMAENVEEARENEIAQYLEELQTVLHNMEYMKNELMKDYEEYAQEEAQEVKTELEELFDAVLEKQEESYEHQQESEEFIEELVDMQEQVQDQQTAQEAIEEVNKNEEDFNVAESAQQDAQNLLDVIVAKAEITGMKKTLEQAQIARNTQEEVNALQAESKQLVWQLREENSRFDKTLEDQKKEQEKFDNQLKPEQQQAEKNLEEKKSAKENAAQELAKAEQEQKQAQQERNDANQAAQKANQDFNKARDERNQAENKARNENNNAQQKERDLKNAQDKTQRAERELENAQKSQAEKQEKFDKANEELAKAEQAKSEAEKNKAENQNAFRDAENKFNNAKRSADQAKAELNRAQDQAKNRANELERAKGEEANRKEQFEKAQASKEEAAQKLEASKQKQAEADATKKAAEAARNQAESKLRQENSELDAARRNDRNAQNALSNAERNLNQKNTNVKNSEKRLDELAQQAEAHKQAAKEKAKQLDTKDNKASEAQKALMEMVKKVAQIAASEEAIPDSYADESMISPELANTTLDRLPLSEAYDKARELEHQIAERSRDIKAAELAISQNMSLQHAAEITDLANTQRPEFDKDVLNSTPTTEAEFNAKHEEMTKVIREAENISAIARSVMEEASAIAFPERYEGSNSSGSGSRKDRLSRMYEISEMENQISSAGSEDSNTPAKDLAEMMAAADSMMSESSGSNSSSSSSSSMSSQNSQGDSQSSQMGSSSSRSSRGPMGGRASRANTARWIKTAITADDFTGEKGPTDLAVRGGSAEGMGVPSLSRGMDGLVAGNFIGPSGVMPAKWARIVNWYIIGPFPNPNRVNLRRKFAPESKVDLDATYVGKGGRPISWEYEAYRLHVDEIRPLSQEHTGIWYAYTEIMMEEADDVWVAVGSDDRMDVWINDFHVWGSTDRLKYWRINEGFRKVHLRKGKNTVLVRVENGQYVISWSMFIAKENPE